MLASEGIRLTPALDHHLLSWPEYTELLQGGSGDVDRVAMEAETYETLMQADPRRRGFYKDQLARLQSRS